MKRIAIAISLFGMASAANASTVQPGDLLILEELIISGVGLDGGSVVRLDPDTESQTQIASSLAFDRPIDFAVDGAGNTFILEQDNDDIYRFDAGGALTDVISVGPLGQGSLVGNRIALWVVPIPEPSTALLLAGGLLGLARGGRRRKA